MDKFIAITLGLALIVFFFWPVKKAGSRKDTAKHQFELLSRCGGDREMMERLISLELKRDPSLSMEEAARYAVVSHKRDSR